MCQTRRSGFARHVTTAPHSPPLPAGFFVTTLLMAADTVGWTDEPMEARMPGKPPLLGGNKRKAWARQDGRPDRRLRGRAGQRDRAQVLAEEPLCRVCQVAGRVSAAVEVDHVVPLSRGGTEARSNKQGLCRACHRAKSAAESAAGQAMARAAR